MSNHHIYMEVPSHDPQPPQLPSPWPPQSHLTGDCDPNQPQPPQRGGSAHPFHHHNGNPNHLVHHALLSGNDSSNSSQSSGYASATLSAAAAAGNNGGVFSISQGGNNKRQRPSTLFKRDNRNIYHVGAVGSGEEQEQDVDVRPGQSITLEDSQII